MFLPETPIFLIGKGKNEEAKTSLKILRGAHYNINEYFELQKQSDEHKIDNASFYQEFRSRASRKAFIIIIFMFAFFQLSGINAVIYYSTQIFTDAKISIEPYIATVVLGVIQVFGVLLAIPFIDRYGRKFLLIPSFAVMSVSMFCIGGYFHLKDAVDMTAIKFLPIIFLCFFLIGFSLGIGTIAFVLIGELFSMNAKKVIAPLAQTTNYILGFMIALFFPKMVSTVGAHYTFYIFSSVSAFGIFFTIFFIPETKGKSLMEIQKKLSF
jgi:MFS family permease